MQSMRIKLGWPLDRDEVTFLKKSYKSLNKNRKTFQAMVEKHDTYVREANLITVGIFKAFEKKWKARLAKNKQSRMSSK